MQLDAREQESLVDIFHKHICPHGQSRKDQISWCGKQALSKIAHGPSTCTYSVGNLINRTLLSFWNELYSLFPLLTMSTDSPAASLFLLPWCLSSNGHIQLCPPLRGLSFISLYLAYSYFPGCCLILLLSSCLVYRCRDATGIHMGTFLILIFTCALGRGSKWCPYILFTWHQ